MSPGKEYEGFSSENIFVMEGVACQAVIFVYTSSAVASGHISQSSLAEMRNESK